MSPLNELNNISTRFPQDKIHSCVKLPNSEKPGYSPIYRNAASPNELVGSFKGLTTLHELFQNAVNLFGNDNCLGERLTNARTGELDKFYTYQTYNQIDKRRLDVASGLIHYVLNSGIDSADILDPVTKKAKFVVSVSGVNSIEMLVLDLATRSFSIPNTGLYESLTSESSTHIFKLTKSPILFLNKHLVEKYLDLKLSSKDNDLEKLKIFVTFEPLSEIPSYILQRVKASGIQIVDFKTIETLGTSKRLPADYNLPKPETLYTLAFTSGTTGLPKGVYLTHENATANVIGFFVHCPKPAIGLSPEHYNDFSYNKDARGEQLKTICFLPLLHNYEKSITNFEMSYGIALALPSQPGTKSLFEDVKIIKPSLFTGVPRVFTLVENEIKKRIKASGFTKLEDQSNFIKRDLGFENISFLQCASAPISKESILYLKSILNCGFLNSYGATELFSVMSFSNPYEVLAGSSGPTCVSAEIKLKDVAEMGYTSKDQPFPRGEVLIRGKSQFSHYFQNEKETKKAIDEEGWYHSGDVAGLDHHGNLFIIDRVKNFFKLSQGEYVTPERVETIYLSKNPVLTQLFVHGDSYSNFLIGIAGIDIKGIRSYLKEAGLIEGELNDQELLNVLKDAKVKRYLLDHLSSNVKDSNLKGYEKLHNVHFDIEPLSIANESLTPSFKLKRNGARKAHSDKIKELYKEGSLLKRSVKL